MQLDDVVRPVAELLSGVGQDSVILEQSPASTLLAHQHCHLTVARLAVERLTDEASLPVVVVVVTSDQMSDRRPSGEKVPNDL